MWTQRKSVREVYKWMMLGVSTLQHISKFIWWTTSSKIVEFSIIHWSIGIYQWYNQNPLQFFLHKISTKSLKRVVLTVNGKLNTQLTTGDLGMYFPNKFCNTHRIINYSPTTIKWEPPRCRQKGRARYL